MIELHRTIGDAPHVLVDDEGHEQLRTIADTPNRPAPPPSVVAAITGIPVYRDRCPCDTMPYFEARSIAEDYGPPADFTVTETCVICGRPGSDGAPIVTRTASLGNVVYSARGHEGCLGAGWGASDA